MSLYQVPYPKASFYTFAKVLAVIGLSVAFILIVFQPFGTSRFVHPQKTLILAGYGVVVFVAGLVWLQISNLFVSQAKASKWSVVDEVLMIFLTVICCLVACYFYYTTVFAAKANVRLFGYFLMYSSTVAILPVGAYLIYIYHKYKEVRHSTLEISSDQHKTTLHLTGTTKSDQLSVSSDQLLYVKSSDNYVIVHVTQDGEVIKKMLRSTLSSMANQLDDSFVRAHRQYLVNTAKVLSLSGNITNTKLSLVGSNDVIPVSRSMVPYFRNIVQ